MSNFISHSPANSYPAMYYAEYHPSALDHALRYMTPVFVPAAATIGAAATGYYIGRRIRGMYSYCLRAAQTSPNVPITRTNTERFMALINAPVIPSGAPRRRRSIGSDK
jgi:hypothetical protein